MNKNILIGSGIIVVLVVGFLLMNNDVTAPKDVVKEPDRIVGENLEGEADPARMTLGMNKWRWIETLYNDERIIKPKKEGVFTIAFLNDGTFGVTTDCNSMGGKYVADKSKGTISFTEIVSTEMYCEGSQESEFASMLQNASAYHFTSRGELKLDLKFDSGTVTFR